MLLNVTVINTPLFTSLGGAWLLRQYLFKELAPEGSTNEGWSDHGDVRKTRPEVSIYNVKVDGKSDFMALEHVALLWLSPTPGMSDFGIKITKIE